MKLGTFVEVLEIIVFHFVETSRLGDEINLWNFFNFYYFAIYCVMTKRKISYMSLNLNYLNMILILWKNVHKIKIKILELLELHFDAVFESMPVRIYLLYKIYMVMRLGEAGFCH